jgi:hypothetical protein
MAWRAMARGNLVDIWYRVFEVEDQCISFILRSLLHPGSFIAGDKQQRAQRFHDGNRLPSGLGAGQLSHP